MSEQDDVNDDTLNVTVDDTEGDVSDTDTNDTDNQGSAEETPEERIARLEAQNKKLFNRAKEAEGYKLVNGQWVKKESTPKPQAQPTQTKSEFDLEDVAVLVQQVPVKEDRELVKTWAKREGKSLEEMLKDSLVQARLKEKAEERKTSEVAHTGGGRRVTAKVSEEQLLNKASSGNYTEMDPESLAEASFKSKLKK